MNSKHPKYRPAITLLASLTLEEAEKGLKELDASATKDDVLKFAVALTKDCTGQLADDIVTAIYELRRSEKPWEMELRAMMDALAHYYVSAAQESTEEINKDSSHTAPWERRDPNDKGYIYDLANTLIENDDVLGELRESVEDACNTLVPIPSCFLKEEEDCPGCGCCPGDGITESCEHPDGCGFWKKAKAEAEAAS